jgi:hypothetical protein
VQTACRYYRLNCSIRLSDCPRPSSRARKLLNLGCLPSHITSYWVSHPNFDVHQNHRYQSEHDSSTHRKKSTDSHHARWSRSTSRYRSMPATTQVWWFDTRLAFFSSYRSVQCLLSTTRETHNGMTKRLVLAVNETSNRKVSSLIEQRFSSQAIPALPPF